MKAKKLLVILVIALVSATMLESCKGKPNDEEIKSKIETAVANPAVRVEVKDGDVTLSGSVSDEGSKNAAETATKTVEDVKNVTNALAVDVPMPVQNEVQISNDSEINSQLIPLLANYKNVKARVDSGVVTLTGNIKRSELPQLLQAIMALKPKRVENQLTIK